MVELIKAECPKCGAELQLYSNLKKGYCTECGGKFIVAKDGVDFQETAVRITCPSCKGDRETRCSGIEIVEIKGRLKTYEIYNEGCFGSGKCQVSYHPENTEALSNYCRDGKCAWCKGTGRSLFGSCKFCDGTGGCQFCYGSGKCKFCNGRGEIRCKVCDGRGYIVYRVE